MFGAPCYDATLSYQTGHQNQTREKTKLSKRKKSSKREIEERKIGNKTKQERQQSQGREATDQDLFHPSTSIVLLELSPSGGDNSKWII